MRLTAILISFLFTFAVQAQEIVGDVALRDGDEIWINGQDIHLWGIDAPAMESPYGIEALDALTMIASFEPIRCAEKSRDGNLIIAQCFNSEDQDLASELVRQGFAVDWPEHSCGFYAEDEIEAREAELAMWAGGMRSWREGDPGPDCNNE